MSKELLFFMSFFLSACVQLTPAGSHVQILHEDQRTLVTGCRPLAVVSVSSEAALRNTTAALSGDTAIMSNRDVSTTTIVRGEVFRCSALIGKMQRRDELKSEPNKTDAEYLRKSTLCQSKGGDWFSGQCVIPIE